MPIQLGSHLSPTNAWHHTLCPEKLYSFPWKWMGSGKYPSTPGTSMPRM